MKDGLVKVSETDSAPGYLEDKILISDGLLVTKTKSIGGKESLSLKVDINNLPDLQTALIETPVIVSPNEGVTVAADSFNILVGPYSTVNHNEPHTSTDWQVATDDAFLNIAWESLNDTTNLESITTGILTPSTTYYVRVRYRSATYTSPWSQVRTVIVPFVGINKPSVIAPANGSLDMPLEVNLNGSTFMTTNTDETHISTDWEVATDAGFTNIVISSYDDTANLTGFFITGLDVNTLYHVRVRYKSTTYISDWSDPTSFTTVASVAAFSLIQTLNGSRPWGNFGVGITRTPDKGLDLITINDYSTIRVFEHSGVSWTETMSVTPLTPDDYILSAKVSSTKTSMLITYRDINWSTHISLFDVTNPAAPTLITDLPSPVLSKSVWGLSTYSSSTVDRVITIGTDDANINRVFVYHFDGTNFVQVPVTLPNATDTIPINSDIAIYMDDIFFMIDSGGVRPELARYRFNSTTGTYEEVTRYPGAFDLVVDPGREISINLDGSVIAVTNDSGTEIYKFDTTGALIDVSLISYPAYGGMMSGQSVSVNDTYVVIQAVINFEQGYVLVYDHSNIASSVAELYDPNIMFGFGETVVIPHQSNDIFVSSPYEDAGTVSSAGKVYIYG